MSDAQPSLALFIIAAVLSGIGGYLTRRVQKYEDSKDEVHLKILPAMCYQIMSIIMSIEIYKEKHNYNEFKTRLQDISTKLGESISSGEALIAKINLQELTDLYWNIERLKIHLDEIKGNDSRKDELLKAFDTGNKEYSAWLKVDPQALLEDSKAINQKIEKKINAYRSISITVIILIIIVAIIIGLTGYVNNFVQPHQPVK